MDRVEAAVVGGGVIGLSVARALAKLGREVVVLEAQRAIGTGTSSRNSEVIHAGIYYPTGSLKGRFYPGLDEAKLVEGYTGIRPKISGPGERPGAFCIRGPADHSGQPYAAL